MKRTPLSERTLPTYSKGEEIMNMTTHIVGAVLGILALVLCLVKARDALGRVCAGIYGGSMILLYTVSSIYHGLKPGTGKKVLQIIDHCTIYLLIAGTYTPVALYGLGACYPTLAWGLTIFQWGTAILAATLTAIDLRSSRVFSMLCYIGMGWAVIPFRHQAMNALGTPGFRLLLAGGIAYTIGAILYGIGAKRKWMHPVFHIFVVLGSLFQFFCIYFFLF